MEGMLAGIIAVEDNLNHLILLQHESIHVYAINSWVGGCSTGCKSGEKGRDFRLHVGDSVEECTGSSCQRGIRIGCTMPVLICTISKIVHFHIQLKRKVGVFKEFNAILWH